MLCPRGPCRARLPGHESGELWVETPPCSDQRPHGQHGAGHCSTGLQVASLLGSFVLNTSVVLRRGTEVSGSSGGRRGWGGLGGPRADLSRPQAGRGAGGFLGLVQEGPGGKEVSDPWGGLLIWGRSSWIRRGWGVLSHPCGARAMGEYESAPEVDAQGPARRGRWPQRGSVPPSPSSH